MSTRSPDFPVNAMPDDDAPPPSGLSSMQRAILTIQRMRSKIESLERARVEPVAIIGMACRFPGGASTPEAFFRLLEDGVDTVTEVPPERWRVRGDGSDQDAETRALRWGSFLKDVDRFDAAFFGISPREAESLDPQQRILLEVTWEALERAGQVPERLMGSRTGVFVGIWSLDYQQHVLAMRPEKLDAYCFTGNVLSTAAGRLSYVLGLQGPCMSVEAACSSSLVAIHLACQSLRNGESNLALAGGANLVLSPSTTQLLGKTQALSPDGRCKTFDARANGFVRGEGCGVVVLKRLSDAERDGDPILAVIRGSAVNQDGRSTGLTAPNVLSQQALLRQALESARVSPVEIGYVEAHGTGTSLGDPIEVEALKAVLGAPREDRSTCALGALKTNIGHLEAAAGVAGLIKTVLVLQNERIPRNIHFKTLNPRIVLQGTPLVIPWENQPWKAGAQPRVAGVSSFGISGTNAHIIVEEAPPTTAKASEQSAAIHLLPLSARSAEALDALAASYREFFQGPGADAQLADVAYTASMRRTHHAYRMALVAQTREEMVEKLEALSRGEKPAGVARTDAPATERPKIVFVFPGQGSQWLGMGRQLLAEEATFRATLESCDEMIAREADVSVIEELEADEGKSRLDQIDVVQPVLFAIEVALAALWQSWGVEPDCVIGHSMGEVAAAHVAGILSLEDAARVICRRSRLLRGVSGRGAMALVELTLEEAERALAGYEARLSVAVSNGPRSTVISGDPGALEEVLARLEQRDVFCRRVKVDVASHSPQMDPLRDDLLAALSRLRPREGSIPMRSTVTGQPAKGTQLDAEYWVKNLRAPVLFSQATQRLIDEGHTLFVEMSPHPILLPSIEENLEARGRSGAALASLRRQTDERRCMLEALGALYAHSQPVDWSKRHPTAGRFVSLPTYPWQRERFWIEADPAAPLARGRGVTPGRHPLLGPSFTTSTQPGAWLWQSELRLEDLPYLADHRIRGTVLFPGAAYVEAALAASHERLGAETIVLEDMDFLSPLVLRKGEPTSIEVVLAPESTGAWSFRFSSLSRGEDGANGAGPSWTLHAVARVRRGSAEDAPRLSEPVGKLRERIGAEVSLDEIERIEREHGIEMGPAFRALRNARRGPSEVLGQVALHESTAEQGGSYFVHPVLLDAALRLTFASLLPKESDGRPQVLARIGRLRLHARAGREAWTLGQTRRGDGGAKAMVALLDDDDRILLDMDGIETRPFVQVGPGHDAHADVFVSQKWLLAQALPQPRDVPGGRWLILCDDKGFGEEVRAHLVERGAEVFCAWTRGTAARPVAGRPQIDPGTPQEIAALIRDVLGSGGPLTGIVHCWGLWPDAAGPLTLDELESAGRYGHGSALHLVQALTRLALRDMPRLWLVVRGTQMVPDEPRDIALAQAPLWGLGRVIATEYPELRCARVDLDVERPEGEAAAFVRELLAEGSEEEIALRGARRFVGRLVNAEVPRAAAEPAEVVSDATYLITGGLGGLGLHAARWLAGAGARHLVLMGRQGTTTPAQAAALSALEAGGVEVRVVKADVADSAQLADALSAIDTRMPPLRGVVHTAGVLEDGLLDNQSLERFRKVLAPKVLGGFNLHQQMAHRSLDFFILYSSMASLLGPPGLGNYVAANSFLDALAHYRRRLGLVATTIDWGLFADVGMAVKAEGAGRISQHGMRGFTPEDGEALFLRALRERWVQMGVVSMDFGAWVETYPQIAGSPRFSPLVQASRTAPRKQAHRDQEFLDRLSRTPRAERATVLAGLVRQHLAEILRMDPARIDRLTPLRALGIDSLMSLELRNRLEAALGIKLSATLVWSYPNVAALAEHLLGSLAGPATSIAPAPAQGHAPAAAVAAPEPSTADDDLLASFDQSMTRVRGRRRS